MSSTEYRVVAYWTHPGPPLPGGVDLDEGWARSFDAANFDTADEVAHFLKSHPDAWGADVVTLHRSRRSEGARRSLPWGADHHWLAGQRGGT